MFSEGHISTTPDTILCPYVFLKSSLQMFLHFLSLLIKIVVAFVAEVILFIPNKNKIFLQIMGNFYSQTCSPHVHILDSLNHQEKVVKFELFVLIYPTLSHDCY